MPIDPDVYILKREVATSLNVTEQVRLETVDLQNRLTNAEGTIARLSAELLEVRKIQILAGR